MEFVLVLIVALFFAGFTGAVAGSKGHDSGPWYVGGLLLGPLALLASLGLPDLTLRRYLRLMIEHQGIEPGDPPSPKDLGKMSIGEQRRRIGWDK